MECVEPFLGGVALGGFVFFLLGAAWATRGMLGD